MENYLRGLRRLEGFIKAYIGDTRMYIIVENREGVSLIDPPLLTYFTLASDERILKNIALIDSTKEKELVAMMGRTVKDYILFYK